MEFWTWFWRLIAGLPWGMVGAAIAGILLLAVGCIELKWRLLRGLSAFSYAREEIRFEVDWRFWPSLAAMICVLCLSMFGFYSVQVERSAVLPVGWQDGQRFLLCATLGSWTFGLAVFKLLKGEVDWRLTTVFFMLGWL